MPVIDLNDYLGMPQQAPVQPVFRATTQNVDPMALRADNPYSSDAFLANVEARQRLAGLQRLAPVLQAQQAQLAYDKVAEDARLLRQKQEIEAQVQRATDEITQGAIDPESDQFNQQVMGLYTRNPMAFADPRMQQAMSFLGRRADELAQQKRLQAEADYEARKGLSDAINKAETRFLTGGGSINELNRLRQGSASPDDYISLVEEGAGKLRTTRAKGAGKGAGEPEIIGRYKDLKNEFASRAQKAASDLAAFEENAILEDPGYDQKLAALKKKAEDEQALATLYSNAYIASLRSPTGQAAQRPVGPYSPEFLAGYGTAAGQGFIPAIPGLAPAPAGGAAAPASATVEQPASFQDAMKKGQPDIGRILKVDQSEVMKDLDDPAADENTFVAAIKDPNVTLPVKQRALARLNEYVKNPPPIAGATVSDAIRRREQLFKLRDEAEKDVTAFPVVQKYNQAWQSVKGKMDQALDGFAKSIGVSKEQVVNSLKSGDRIFVDQEDVQKGGTSILELFEKYFGETVGKNPDSPAYSLRRKVDELEPFKESEFANRIGMSGFLGSGINASKSWQDVLDAYLSENTNPAAPASIPNKAGIKSIKPIP